MGASDDIITSVLTMKNLDDSIDDVTDSVHEFAKAGKGLDGVKAVFKGIGGVIKSIAPAIGNDTVLSGKKSISPSGNTPTTHEFHIESCLPYNQL